jgi:hypothetical protein
MHHCLEIQEILRVILRSLHDDDRFASIASLAVTCRAFHEPALDQLWQTIKFHYLAWCLPTDLWYLQSPSEGSAASGRMMEVEQEAGNSEEDDEQPNDSMEEDEGSSTSGSGSSSQDEGFPTIVRVSFSLFQLHTHLF